MKSLLPRLLNIARWIWLLSVVVFVARFVSTRYEAFVAASKSVRPEFLLASAFLLVIGKMALTLNMQLALKVLGRNTPFARAFPLYNWTQLSKYIPGGIWFFVGRYRAFDEEGLSVRESTKAMIVELGLLTVSALAIGVGLITLSTPALLESWLLSWHIDLPLGGGFFMLALPLAALMVGLLWARANRLQPSLTVMTRMAMTQVAIWLALGASFGLIVMPRGGANAMWFFIGLYAIAHISGILIPFAPGGMGIREGIIVFGLSPWLGVDGALAVALVHRMLYLVVEILLVLAARAAALLRQLRRAANHG